LPTALDHEGVVTALARLGVVTVAWIGPAAVRDRLAAAEVSEAEAHALEADVDALAKLMAQARG
jgi:hypothetical protein